MWASLYGMGGYLLGNNIQQFTGLVGRITIVLAVLLIIVLLVVVRRNEHHLEEEAERALPGSLDAY